MQHANRRRIGLTLLAIVSTTVAALGAATLTGRGDNPAAVPTWTVQATATLTLPVSTTTVWRPSPPSLPDDVGYSYARIDSTDGDLQIGGDLDRHPLDRLLVPGLTADYLHHLAQRGHTRTPAAEKQIRHALAGNIPAIDWLAAQVGGADKATARIVDACQLEEVRTGPVQAPTLDIARYGACLREAAIADTDATGWLLQQMRATRTGIGETRGDDNLAQQNSTILDGGRYRTGCLAIGPWWTAVVLVNYDAGRGRPYGEAACGIIAGALFPPDTQKVPERTTSQAPSGVVS